MKNLWEAARLAWRMSAYAVLGLLWALWLEVFCGKMAPRLAYLAGRPIGNDPPCNKPECDFSDFWRAGLSARHALPKLSALAPGVHLTLPGGYAEGFPYPPPIFLPAALISHLPFELGFFAWTGIWLVLAVLALRWAKLSWKVILLGLLSPASLWNTELGQLGVIGNALLIAGLLGLAARPMRAGAMLGLLVCKPQMGLLAPAALLGGRNWRGAGGFVLAAGVLALLSLAVFGWPLWQGYLGSGRHGGVAVLNAQFIPTLAAGTGVSVYWMLRSLHAGVGLAAGGQAVCSVAAFLSTLFIWSRRDVQRLDAAALTVFLALLTAPYGYADDMVATSVMLVALAERSGWRIGMADMLFFMWPALVQPVTEATGVLLTPVVIAWLVVRSWSRAGLALPHLPGRAAVLPRAG